MLAIFGPRLPAMPLGVECLAEAAGAPANVDEPEQRRGLNDSGMTRERRNVAAAKVIALLRTGENGIKAVANHDSVNTLWCVTSCLFYDGSTCIDKLL